jgi:hypothetical protein
MSRFRCHINVEICSSVRSIKYIFKYINKGHDTATAEFGLDSVDEIKRYVTGRIVTSIDACSRIFGFNVHKHSPAVTRLAIHLDNELDLTDEIHHRKSPHLQGFLI